MSSDVSLRSVPWRQVFHHSALVLRASLSAHTNTSSPRAADYLLPTRECSDNSACGIESRETSSRVCPVVRLGHNIFLTPGIAAAGAHTLRFESTGKASASAGYLLGFDALVARVPVHKRPADFDLRDIQVP